MRMNHLAIVVEDVQAALAFWRDALGLPLGSLEHNANEEVEIAFLPLEDNSGEIELIAPVNDSSGVAKYLAKRGMGMHHLCLEVTDIAAVMRRLTDHGVELINDTPKINDQGNKYCFVHPRSSFGVLLELYETARQSPSQPRPRADPPDERGDQGNPLLKRPRIV